ncbi:MAG: peptidoglycan-binding domain-containing protein [Christensenellales bacterium]|jgi:peptidoglycan hydrolase-like protein with peptidoglycan-binding domain
MSQQEKRPSLRPKALAVLALLLIAAIAFVLIKTSATRRAYDALLETTVKPTLSPPLLSFQATDALFRMGSIGPEVIQLQERLKALGYYQGELDGQYGRATQEAISRFQTQNSLEADGMAGALTLSILYGAEAKPAGPDAHPAPQQSGEPVYNP